MTEIARLLLDHTDPTGAAVLLGADNPLTLTGGVNAAVGSLYSHRITGALYRKTGPAATAWASLSGPWINVKDDFDAKGDGTTDDTVALQAAIDAAIAIWRGGAGSVTLLMPRGKYKITVPLRGFYWAAGAFAFVGFTLQGPAPGYASGSGAEIVPTFTDRPPLILQASRAVRVVDVIFRGGLANVNPTYDDCLKDTGGSAGTPWWNSGTAGRDSRYSPYCAIAIDPFSNGLPADGGIPGHSAYYTQNIGSAMITVERCGATNFIVAFATSTSNGSQNAEDITFSDCFTENVKVAYSVGQSQNRNVNILRPRAVFIRSLIDTASYGVGNGVFPNVVGGDVAGACKWLIVNGTPGWSQATIKQLYAEGVLSLGFWGWNATGFPLTLDDCGIHLTPTPAGSFAPASHFHTAAPVIFRGGFFGKYIGAATRQSVYGSGIVWDHGALSGIPMMQRYATSEFNHPTLYYTPNGGVGVYGIQRSISETMATFAPNMDVWMAPMGEVLESITPTEHRKWRWREYEVVIPLDNAAAITVNADGTLTFVSAQASAILQVGEWVATRNPTWNAEKYDAALANVGYQGLAIGRVKTIVGTTVTLDEVPYTMVTGTHNIALRYLPVFRPRTIGTATSGSNVLTNVSPLSTWKVNDRIQANANLPAGCYITAINTGAATMTVSQNATGSGTVELYDQKLFLEDACRSAVPTTDVWFQGDFLRNTAGTKDGNNMILAGWRCTVSGRADGVAPAATFEPQYVSTVTPAT